MSRWMKRRCSTTPTARSWWRAPSRSIFRPPSCGTYRGGGSFTGGRSNALPGQPANALRRFIPIKGNQPCAGHGGDAGSHATSIQAGGQASGGLHPRLFPGSTATTTPRRPSAGRVPKCAARCSCKLTAEAIFDSIRRMKEAIAACPYLRALRRLLGGRRAGRQRAKFIANVLNNKDISEEIHRLLDRGGLILGICNGFQALVKSGLLPYGRLGLVTGVADALPQRHQPSCVADRFDPRGDDQLPRGCRGFSVGDIHSIAVSHGEGQVRREQAFGPRAFGERAGGVPVCRCRRPRDAEARHNPNGSYYAIRGYREPRRADTR